MANKYSERKFFTMYHGTTVSAAYSIIKHGFRVSDGGMLGRGVYVSKQFQKAEKYPIDSTDQNVVLELSVKVGKVKKIDSQDHPLRLTWHDHGYDTAWVPQGCGMVPSNQEEDCVFDPHRIRVTKVAKAPPQHKDSLNSLIPKRH